MGNKTIYVKDEALWDKAKRLAGKEGLSSLIGDALREFVRTREDERRGLRRHTIWVSEAAEGGQHVGFEGRLIGEADYGDSDTVLRVYQTKAGNLISFVGTADPGVAYNYSVHDSLKSMIEDPNVGGLENPGEFLNSLGDTLGEKWTVWID